MNREKIGYLLIASGFALGSILTLKNLMEKEKEKECAKYDNPNDCWLHNCYWWGNSCHKSPPPVSHQECKRLYYYDEEGNQHSFIQCLPVEGYGEDECQTLYDCPCMSDEECPMMHRCTYEECLPIIQQEIHWNGTEDYLEFELQRSSITTTSGIIKVKGGILCPYCSEPLIITAKFTDRYGNEHEKIIFNRNVNCNWITETKVYVSEMFEPTPVDKIIIYSPSGTGYCAIKRVDLIVF